MSASRSPGASGDARVPLGSGWDCDAVLVDGHRVERTPRRPDVERSLRLETTLLPWLAPRLPLAVPRPVVLGEAPLVVAHDLLPGEPLTDPTPGHGALLGTFLRALHDTPADGAVARGLPDAVTSGGHRDAAFDRFAVDVLPRVADPGPLRARLAELRDAPTGVVVHGDLGPDHVRCTGGRITGVIDWGDARCGDAAKDLTWLLHECRPGVAGAVLEAYGGDPDGVLRARSATWRAVAPCWAVTHGLDTGDEALVDAALRRLDAVGAGQGRRT